MDPTKISVIIPVLNERPTIRETLLRLRDSALPQKIEIVLVDGGSADGTAEAAATSADKVIVTRRGRAHQMHVGALASTGNVLLFLHADTRLPAGWHRALEQAWVSIPPPSCTAFQISFDRAGWRYRWIERSARFRSRLTGIPHGDQAISVSRAAYFSAGGYPDVPLMEEYCLVKSLKPMGRVRFLPSAVVTSSRRYEKNGPFLNALRNTLIVVLFQIGFSPALLARMYR